MKTFNGSTVGRHCAASHTGLPFPYRTALLGSMLLLAACGGADDVGSPATAPPVELPSDDSPSAMSTPEVAEAMPSRTGSDRMHGDGSRGSFSPFSLASGDELLFGGDDKIISYPDTSNVADPAGGDAYANGHDAEATLVAGQETDPSDTEHTTVTPGPTYFESNATPGFGARLNDDKHVELFWKDKSDARGYNLYRDSKYYKTVFENRYTDEEVTDKNYYYEVVAFDQSNHYERVASGLTVEVWGTGTTYVPIGRRKSNFLDDYELKFADEFDSLQLDTLKWNTAFLWGPDLVINSEAQYYVDIGREPWFGWNPFVLDGEHLTIRAAATPAGLRQKANDQPYLSGIITSYDHFKFTYGYVEARAKVPYGRGLWPAFWLLNHQYVGGKPEIDIMEFIGHDRDVVYHTYHYFDHYGTLRSTPSQPTTGTDFTNGFHTYGVDWSPGLLVFYVNGVEVHRISDPSVSSQDMYVIANLAVGGWWAGLPDASTVFPADYVLDYIRVYQRKDGYADTPYYDAAVPPLPETSGRTDVLPNHRPNYVDWPTGYPEGH